MLSRRRLLQVSALGGVALWVWGLPRVSRLFPADLSFSPLTHAPPFRRLDNTGTSSALSNALAGLDATPLPDVDPCAALYDGAATGIAIFSDANCPNCPAMEANVTAAAKDTGFTVFHRSLPILGPTSLFAAQAMIAAQAQPNGDAFRDALIKASGLPAPRFIAALAADHGLDPDQLRRDMKTPATQAAIDRDRAVARKLGLIGTPATVIGRSILLGTLPERTVRQIITQEQQMDPPCN